MYIAIRNRGCMNRIALTLFGYSTKRDRMDDPTIIGNKGSGLKLAALAAMRLGLRMAVSSTDHKGLYFLSYEREDIVYGEVVVPQIMLDWQEYVDGGIVSHREPWYMSVDAFRDWDQVIGSDDVPEYKMFREPVANAYDEDKAFRMERVEELSFASPGETVVFVEWNEGIERLLLNSERYFTFLNAKHPHKELGGVGAIRKKSQKDVTRLFVTGMMVECAKDAGSRAAFDYALNDKSLASEERIIKDRTRFVRSLGSMLVEHVHDPQLGRALLGAAFIDNGLEAAAFRAAFPVSPAAKVFWLARIAEYAGSGKVCVACGNAGVDNDAEQVYGHVVLRTLSSGAKDFLLRIGVPYADAVVPKPEEAKDVPFEAIDDAHRALFIAEYRLLAKYYPSRAGLPYRFYVDPAGTDTRVAYCVIGEEPAVISVRVIAGKRGYEFPDLKSLRIMPRHEGRHIETGKGDSDRGFMIAAENEIDALIARLEGHFTSPDGKEVLPLRDVSDAYPSFVRAAAFRYPDAGALLGTDRDFFTNDTEPDMTLDDLSKEIVLDPLDE